MSAAGPTGAGANTLPLVVELFAGPGGWSTGLRWAGCDGPAVGLEHDRAACLTAVAAGHLRVQADVATYPTAPFAGRTWGLIASPPCPSFSTAGDGAGKVDTANVLRLIADYANGREPGGYEWSDERSRLTAQPMRWAVALRPSWIALEQVPPVLPIWQYMAALLRKLGYRTWCGVLSAEEYGVPQTRKRAILTASLDGPVGCPAPTHQPYRAGQEAQTEPDLFGDPLPPPVSMAEALGWVGVDPPARTVCGDRAPRWAYGQGNSYATGWTLRSNYGTGGDSAARGHRGLGQPGPTVTSKVGRNRWLAPAGVTSEMVDPRPDSDPAHTITGKGTAAWVHERPATTVPGDSRIWPPGHKVNADDRARHADADDRYGTRAGTHAERVSVEEAGVLQSFPRDYPWRGTKTAQYRQVGDAVPPLLAAAILRPLLEQQAGEVAA